MFWALYLLARAIVGRQQAVLAVLLTMTVSPSASPGLEFGPAGAGASALGAAAAAFLALIGQNRRNAWFALSIEAGLLLLTTLGSALPVALLVVFALATGAGAHAVSFDPLFALLVIVSAGAALPVWLIRADSSALPALPPIAELCARPCTGPAVGGLVLALAGDPAAGRAQFRLLRSNPKRRRSSFGRRSIRWRAISSISSRLRRRLAAA